MVGEPAVIYGHSLGGEVGVAVAAEHPELVRGLIVGDAPLSTKNHPTEESTHKAMNALWCSLAGRPIEEIVPALHDTPVRIAGQEKPVRVVEVYGEEHPWFRLQAETLHRLDPDMLAAVLEDPQSMLVGYDPVVLLPAIRCPVLLLQGDPANGGLLRDNEIELAGKLLSNVTHVRLTGIGHELHGPPNQAPIVFDAITPFLEGLRAPKEYDP